MREKLEKIYFELEEILLTAPQEEDCTEDENEMYTDIGNLVESMSNVINNILED